MSSFGFIYGLLYLPESNAVVLSRKKPKGTVEEGLPLLGSESSIDDGVAISHADAIEPIQREDTVIQVFDQAQKLEKTINSIGYPAVAAVTGYALLCFLVVVLDEIYAIWANSPLGIGLGFTSVDVGLSLLPMGFVLVIAQIVLYPWISKRVESVAIYRASLLMYPMTCIAFPLLGMLANSEKYKDYLWPCLLGTLAIRYFIGTVSFTAIMILVCDSAPEGKLGLVNGCGQSAAALGRSVGPTLAGSLFAWSIQSGLSFPFDKNLVWCFLAILSSICLFQAYCLPDSLRPSLQGKAVEGEMVVID